MHATGFRLMIDTSGKPCGRDFPIQQRKELLSEYHDSEEKAKESSNRRMVTTKLNSNTETNTPHRDVVSKGQLRLGG